MKKLTYIILAYCVLIFSTAAADENPLFLAKMNDPDNYNPEDHLIGRETICGSNDLQHVEFYDGRYDSLGYTKNAVASLGRSAGIIKTTSSATAGGICSGTMIGHELFLTASHCVGADSTDHYVHFGYQLNGATGALRNVNYANYRIEEIVEDGVNVGLDYAVVRLAGWTAGLNPFDFPGSIDVPIGWRPVAARTPNHAIIVQYPGGAPKRVDAGTSINASGNNLHYADIDTQGGSSGSGILDESGRLVGVHTNGGCGTSGGSNRGVAVQAIRAYSDFVAETPVTSTISDMVIRRYRMEPMSVNLYSSKQSSVLFSHNLDSGRYVPVSWLKPLDAYTRVQYSVGNGSWKYFDMYDKFTSVARLCLSTNRANGTPAGCENAPAIYGGDVHFRFRTEGNGQVGSWRYMRPIRLYYDS